MRKISKYILVVMLMAGLLGVFTSCHEDAPTVSGSLTITITNDFTEVVEAINNGYLKQEEAIAKLTQAIDKMNDDQKVKMQALMDILTSQTNKLEAKLALIEAVIGVQTLKLQEKYDLLIKAVEKNTLKLDQLSTKLAKCIDNMNGTLSGRLKDIRDLLEESNDDIIDKLILITAAMEAHTLSFEEKMKLLKEAVDNNTLKIEEKGDLIANAIDAVNGTMEEKLGSIFSVLDTLGTVHAEKLALIEGTMKAQTLMFEKKMNMLRRVIKNLPNYTDQLEAIETAIKNLPDYSEKIGAIAEAIDAMSDYGDKIDAVSKMLAKIVTQMQNDATAQGDIKTQLENIVTAIDNLKTEVATGNTDEKTALAEIIAKLEALKGSIGGGSGSGSGSGGGSGSGITGLSGTSAFTQSNYYQWDAVDPVNGTNPGYNTTTTSNATNSCKNAPTAEEMKIYLGNGVYYDKGDAGTNQQSYTIEGTTYHAGLWVKKWENCDKSLSAETVSSAPLFNTGRPADSDIHKYFFLPACGNYESGSYNQPGIYGWYWSSTSTTTDGRTYGFVFTDTYVNLGNAAHRGENNVPMTGFDPTYTSSGIGSGIIGLSGNSVFTQSNYYQWDAVTPINGTNPGYNNTTTGNATNSCKNAPTAEEMEIYLGNGVYYDNGEAGNQQSYRVDGTTYHAGLWLKKQLYIDKTKRSVSVTPTPGRPDVSEIDKYFFLPACGHYDNGSSSSGAGTKGYYWLSTSDNLYFDSSSAYITNFIRSSAFVPMIHFDPTY